MGIADMMELDAQRRLDFLDRILAVLNADLDHVVDQQNELAGHMGGNGQLGSRRVPSASDYGRPGASELNDLLRQFYQREP